jgi:hypothetical protein
MPSATAMSAKERAVWQSLQQAIAQSSGFQRWLSLQVSTDRSNLDSLEDQVRLYLRETLETLAY